MLAKVYSIENQVRMLWENQTKLLHSETFAILILQKRDRQKKT